MKLRRRTIAIAVAVVALGVAGAATAAVLTRTVTLKSGKCVTIKTTRVCAASSRPVTVRVAGPASTTVTNLVTVTAPPPPPAVAFADGTFVVGNQIQAGTYQASSGSDCYWARLRGFSGGFGDIIANSFARQTIVTIEPSDAGFESKSCGNWTKIG